MLPLFWHLLIAVCLGFIYNLILLAFTTHRVNGDTREICPKLGTPSVLRNTRFLGLDRIEQIIRANHESRLLELFLFHFQRCGTTLEHTFLGVRALGTIDPANIAVMLGTTDATAWSISARSRIMAPILGCGVLTQEGFEWKGTRRLLKTHLLAEPRNNKSLYQRSVGEMLLRLPHDSVVDLQPHFFALPLDITLGYIFGELDDSVSSASRNQFARDFDTMQEAVVSQLRLPFLRWSPRTKRADRAVEAAKTYVDRLIDQAITRTESVNGCGYFHVLQQKGMSRDDTRGQIFNLLVAGRDTTACLLSWAV